MNSASREPVENVVHSGIKRDIELLLRERRMRGALLLTMAGIDAMTYATMPEGQLDVTGADFIRWVERYMTFDAPLSGEEVWGARCGLLHTYGIESKTTRRGVRQIGYFSGLRRPYVRADASISTALVMVSVEGFIEAFFRGIDRCLIENMGDPLVRPIVESRLRRCIHELPQNPIGNNPGP